MFFFVLLYSTLRSFVVCGAPDKEGGGVVDVDETSVRHGIEVYDDGFGRGMSYLSSLCPPSSPSVRGGGGGGWMSMM